MSTKLCKRSIVGGKTYNVNVLQNYEEATTCFWSGLIIGRDLQDAHLEGQLPNDLAASQQAQGKVKLIQAIAMDGQPAEASQMATDLSQLTARGELLAEVIAVFQTLAYNLTPLIASTRYE